MSQVFRDAALKSLYAACPRLAPCRDQNHETVYRQLSHVTTIVVLLASYGVNTNCTETLKHGIGR